MLIRDLRNCNRAKRRNFYLFYCSVFCISCFWVGIGLCKRVLLWMFNCRFGWLQEDESETFDEPSIVPQLKTKVGGVVSTSNQKSKKKKKKKGKEVSSSSSTSNVEKPLDAILESLSLDAPGKSADTKDCDNLGKPCAPSTLQVDPKFLNAENEMRRIFGSKVVRSFEKHERSGSSRMARGGRRSAYIPRKTILITPSEHWPRWDGSLSMEFLHVSEGYHHFR